MKKQFCDWLKIKWYKFLQSCDEQRYVIKDYDVTRCDVKLTAQTLLLPVQKDSFPLMICKLTTFELAMIVYLIV